MIRGPSLAAEVQRRATAIALQRAEESAVVVLNGPRSVGKSTVLKQIGRILDVPIVDLDDPTVRLAVTSDPLRFLQSSRPVLIDEYARVPELLDVIKSRLNVEGRVGQFIKAGSTRYGSTPAVAQALTDESNWFRSFLCHRMRSHKATRLSSSALCSGRAVHRWLRSWTALRTRSEPAPEDFLWPASTVDSRAGPVGSTRTSGYDRKGRH